MKLAVIDLGTNTFHLMLAQSTGTGFKVIKDLKIPVKIGQGGINENRFTKEATDRAMETLISFQNLIDIEIVDRVVTTATSAFRNATNGPEFVEEVRKTTGIAIKTISGQEEAELIYQGVKLALNRVMNNSLIMDIGGGSVEFILANSTKILWMESFEIGAQRLMDKFHRNDPISSLEIAKVSNYLAEKLEPLWNAASVHDTLSLVGSSGTFDTLIDITHQSQEKAKPTGATQFELTIDEFQAIYKQIIGKNRSERSAIPGMIEMRVDMIVVACCLIKTVLDHLNFNPVIQVSSYALKEGILATQLNLTTA